MLPAGDPVDLLWADGVRAYFAGDQDLAVRKFCESLAASDVPLTSLRAKRAFFCACRLLDNGKRSEGIELLRKALRGDPDFVEANVEVCLALSSPPAQTEKGVQQLTDAAVDLRSVGAACTEARLAAANAIVESEYWGDPWQRPAVFLPELESRPFWEERSTFAWLPALEGGIEAVKSEVRTMLPRSSSTPSLGSSWSDVGGEHRASGRRDGDALMQGDWKEIVLYSVAEEEAESGRAAAPGTAALVRKLLPDAVAMAEAGAGEVVLSALLPGTHVAPHCAVSNHRLTAHLGVATPSATCQRRARSPTKAWWLEDKSVDVPPCGIRVGADCRTWREGEVLVFDDSYEHEVWNYTNEVRVVLLIRFWHPDLAEASERQAAVQRIEAALARSQRMQLLPPVGPTFAEPSKAVERMLGAGCRLETNSSPRLVDVRKGGLRCRGATGQKSARLATNQRGYDGLGHTWFEGQVPHQATGAVCASSVQPLRSQRACGAAAAVGCLRCFAVGLPTLPAEELRTAEDSDCDLQYEHNDQDEQTEKRQHE
eukprot:TRINITY_DN10565_c0_g1_i5.p1 TRINITY_DN10565_c0_g1~~TRINITY_DN10565_c0_g1_i5.p1  ORF type:complete len:541 (+),score=85.07 TRINITY_DN10565_c0_g1_i5:159-1781(+)